MGMRFRKSIRLGKHVRLNLSKSGIGYSVGTKGYRVTKMANGRTRTTMSIPGTGISHVSESKTKSVRLHTYDRVTAPAQAVSEPPSSGKSSSAFDRVGTRAIVAVCLLAPLLIVAILFSFPFDSSSAFTADDLKLIPNTPVELDYEEYCVVSVHYNTEMNPDYITMRSDPPNDVVRFHLNGNKNGRAEYAVIGSNPGTCVIYAEYPTATGEHIKSVSRSVTVLEPEYFGYSDTTDSDAYTSETQPSPPPSTTYILNTSTKVIHKMSCSYAPTKNFSLTLDYYGALNTGYSVCSHCNPKE